MMAPFEPKLVTLTPMGEGNVSHSANFREAIAKGSIYMLEPENEAGNVKIGTDKKGSVICYIPACNVIQQG